MKNFLIRLKLFFIRLKLKIVHSYDSTFYVNGADTLPPPLAAEAESEALRTAPYNSRSRSLLIEHNLRLVVYIAKKFESTGIGIEDLVSIGTIGLIKVDWDGNELLLSDVLGSDEDMVYRNLESSEEKRVLRTAVESLCPRERLIVELRYGLGGGGEKTQKEVADMLGISQSYISRLEKKIISRLKCEVGSKI